MRTLVITQNITADGAVEMLDQWFDPAQQADDPELLALMRAHQQSCDAVLLGRHTFESFRGFWPQQKDDNTGVSDYLNNTHKYVVSSTITDPGWAKSTVLDGDAADQVRKLKSQAGGDIVLTGSIKLAHSLFAAGLVGRVRLFTYPAMRIGWLVPPADLRSDIVNARYASDLGSPTIPQLALAELLRSGAYDAHIRKLRSRHRARRNAVVDVVDRELPHYTVGGIAAGLHLVLELPDRVSDADLARSLEAAGVRVQPLSMHRQRPGTPGLVIGYAANSVDRLRDAATTIARHIRALLG